MISVVSPRSNNATICNSPYPDSFREDGLTEAVRAHREVAKYLPDITYTPTAVGFCLYINAAMIREFGNLDEIFGGGYNEENDFILRCNRFGYRSVLANKAFVYHLGSVSFSKTEVQKAERERINSKILIERYPEYMPSIRDYFDGTDFKVQSLLAGLVKTRDYKLKFLFDCQNIGPYHNGTFELAINVIKKFVSAYHDRYDFYIACSHHALVFHNIDKIVGLSFCWGNELKMAPFAVAVRLAQPFTTDSIVALSTYAPVDCFLILDTIAIDCLSLGNGKLYKTFQRMLETTSVVGYISQYSKDQTNRRFVVPSNCVEFVSLCSVDRNDYHLDRSIKELDQEKSYVLIVGNHFSHKFVLETLRYFSRLSISPRIKVLGVKVEDNADVESFASGASIRKSLTVYTTVLPS